MNSWTGTRGRQFVALVLITAVLVLGSVFVAYADSTSRQPSAPMPAQAQGDETPTATLSASTQGAEAAVVGSTEVPTPTLTPTFTPPPPVCTPPPCQPGEVYYCPGECPGGCGTQCVRPTEQHPGGPTGVRNVIMNGGFELGFVEGVGVAIGWERFQNGNVHAGWYDDTWDKVVYEGEHAQLMELRDAHEHDRYVGIFQRVHVVPDAEYNLTMYGLVRSDSGSAEASDYGFEMQYGIDYMGGTDWQSPNIEWVTLPWEEQLRTDPTRIDSYTTMIKTHGPGLTLFIRGLKKWPDAVEGNYDIDAVSLVGPLPPSGKWPPGMQPPPGQQPPDMQPPPGQQPPGMQPPPGQHPSPTPGPMMPETGNVFDVLENPVLVVLSIALLVVLVGGAAWGVRQRRI